MYCQWVMVSKVSSLTVFFSAKRVKSLCTSQSVCFAKRLDSHDDLSMQLEELETSIQSTIALIDMPSEQISPSCQSPATLPGKF